MKKIISTSIILILFLLIGCNDPNPKKPKTEYTANDNSVKSQNKDSSCDVEKFIVFDNNSTIDTVIAYLKNNKISYRIEQNEKEICKKYKVRIYLTISDPLSDFYCENCPCANFVIVPTFTFDKFKFKNAIFIFYHEKLTNIVFQDLRKEDEQGQIMELSELYNKKYGVGKIIHSDGGSCEKWIYENKKDSICLCFLSSEEEVTDRNLDFYDKVTGKKLWYDMINLAFRSMNNLSECCKDWKAQQNLRDSVKQRKVLDKI